MRWKVQIVGDEKYLEDLQSVLDILNLDLKIYKEEKKYFIETLISKNLNNAKEISDIAKTYLTFLFHLPYFKSERKFEAPRVENIIGVELFEDKKVIKTYDQEGDLSIENTIWNDGRKDCNIHPQTVEAKLSALPSKIFTSNDNFEQFTTLEDICKFIQNKPDNKELLKKLAIELNSILENLLKFSITSNEPEDEKKKGKILSFLSDLELLNSEVNFETLKWVILYKIFETMGGKHKLKKWCDNDTLDKFTCTAELLRHAEDKKCEEKVKILGKMELSEAEELIPKLFSNYIEEKVNQSKESAL